MSEETPPYNPHALEAEIRALWEDTRAFDTPDDPGDNKFYCLSMFPYPSGALHMGHVRNYTLSDVIARYKRMRGHVVLHPIGWDAFGLPAENAALAHKTSPAQWTQSNIAAMKEQLKSLGLFYDWRREIDTSQPEYYRWEQWLFLKMHEHGLVYKKNSVVNWDPVDQTVLANEQVVEGRGWRSGALVERRTIPQWFFKITDYADRLLDDLDTLTGWPEAVRAMQKNWIGRSSGALVRFPLADQPDAHVPVYTTRIDTLPGVTFLVIAPEHPLAQQAAQNHPEIQAFLDTACQNLVNEANIATLDKQGIPTGLAVRNPLTQALIPVWIGNYVLMNYGTGAVMGVPAHCSRDHAFVRAYPDLKLLPVIAPPQPAAWDFEQAAYEHDGVMTVAPYEGLSNEEAQHHILATLIQQEAATPQVQYRLRDWGVSRQRYWGTPIPMIHCTHCGDVPVPEADLPVVLPRDVTLSSPHSPLPELDAFVNVPCPRCGGQARRETDTFDTFVESSWYFLRYPAYNQNNSMVDQRTHAFAPVDFYVGGVEHAVLHLLYARFFQKVLFDLKVVQQEEPFLGLLTQGMVLKEGAKMSKSKGNTVSPQAMIDTYSADTVRLFMMFAAPPEQDLEWNDAGVHGAHRFLKRLWRLAHEHTQRVVPDTPGQALSPALHEAHRSFHQFLRKISDSYERRHAFNTVIAHCMSFLNLVQDTPVATRVDHACMTTLLQGLCVWLAPITPHITQALWTHLGGEGLIMDAPWPKIDASALQESTHHYVIQINGKKRAQLPFAADLNQAALQAAVLHEPQLAVYLSGKTIVKWVVVPKKLINVVVR